MLRLSFLLLVFTASLSLQARVVDSMSIEELHQAAEEVINYNEDSTYHLLEIALQKIHCLEDGKLRQKHLGENHLRRADYYWGHYLPQSKYHLQKAFEYYRQHPHDKKLAEAYYVKSAIHRKENNKHLHLKNLDTAITYALRADNAQLLASLYTMQGFYLQTYHRWQESFEKARLAIEYAEIASDSLPLSTSYFILAQIKEHFNQLDKAEKLFDQSIAYGQGHYDMAGVYRGYGSVLLKNNKTEEGLAAYRHSMELYSQNKNYPYVMLIRVKLGEALLNQGDLQAAIENFNKSRELLSVLDSNIHLYFLHYAKIYAYLGDTGQARYYINRFLETQRFSELRGEKIDLIKNLAEVYEILGENVNAINYYKKWGTLKDSLQSNTSEQQLHDMEKLYISEKSKNEEITKINQELLQSKNTQFALGIGLLTIVIISGVIIYFVRFKAQKERERLRLQIKENQLKHMLMAQEDERKRLARELHDGIGQSLAALKMQLQMSGDNHTSRQTIQKVNDLCLEIRTLSHQMMPLILQENGLGEALEWLANQSLVCNSMEVDLVIPKNQKRLDPEVETHLYRIGQELLTNIVKHSEASTVGIQLLRPRGKVILIVEDNGIGFKQDQVQRGIGLENIFSRIESIQGEIEMEPNEGGGTYVRIVVPVTEEGRLTA
ncbi:MAG: tetratricopeptide repeat protein [Owenweeksia sp.]|nr:tetratricopeptide repeat protein [Owenweeksia sp.]